MEGENAPSAPKAAKGFSLIIVLILILVTAAAFLAIGYWAGTLSTDSEGQTATSDTPPVPAVPSAAVSSSVVKTTATTTATATAATSASTTATPTAATTGTASASAGQTVVSN